MRHLCFGPHRTPGVGCKPGWHDGQCRSLRGHRPWPQPCASAACIRHFNRSMPVHKKAHLCYWVHTLCLVGMPVVWSSGSAPQATGPDTARASLTRNPASWESWAARRFALSSSNACTPGRGQPQRPLIWVYALCRYRVRVTPDRGQPAAAQLPLQQRERGRGDQVPPGACQLPPGRQQEEQRGRRGRCRQREAHLLARAAQLVLLLRRLPCEEVSERVTRISHLAPQYRNSEVSA